MRTNNIPLVEFWYMALKVIDGLKLKKLCMSMFYKYNLSQS